MKATYSKRMLNLHFKQCEHNKAEQEIMKRKLSRKGYTAGLVSSGSVERVCNFMAPVGHTVAMIKQDYKAIKKTLSLLTIIDSDEHSRLGRTLRSCNSIEKLESRFNAYGWNPVLVVDCGQMLVITTNDNIEYIVGWTHGSNYSAMSFEG